MASTGELGIPGRFEGKSSSELLIMSLWNQGSPQKRMKSTQSLWGECFDLILYKSQNASICEAHQGIRFSAGPFISRIPRSVSQPLQSQSGHLSLQIPSYLISAYMCRRINGYMYIICVGVCQFIICVCVWERERCVIWMAGCFLSGHIRQIKRIKNWGKGQFEGIS